MDAERAMEEANNILRKIAERIVAFSADDSDEYISDQELIAKALLKANMVGEVAGFERGRLKGFNEAVEECEKLAEDHVEFINHVQQQGQIRERTKKQIATAIRKLKKGE